MLISTKFSIGDIVYKNEGGNVLYKYTIESIEIDIEAKKTIQLDYILVDENGVYLTAKEDELFRLAKYKEI